MKIGILSDIHEDAIRLKEAVSYCEKRQCDALFCLGDITGFDVRHYRYLSTRDASYCVSLIRSQCSVVVAGNHDLFSVRRVPQACEGFAFPEQWYAMDFEERKRQGEGRVWLYEAHDLSPCLNASDREYLLHLPEYVIYEYEGRRIFLSHSLQPDLSGSAVWRPRQRSDFDKHFDWMRAHGCTLGLSGHFHPAGAEVATPDSYRYRSFGEIQMREFPQQIIVPCIAAGSGYNGLFILDMREMAGEAVPLKTRPFYFRRFV